MSQRSKTSSQKTKKSKNSAGLFEGLSAEEEEKCDQAFMAFDKDGSDDIDVNELKIVLKMMGIKVSDTLLQRMMFEASPNDPSMINRHQFKRVISRQRHYQNISN